MLAEVTLLLDYYHSAREALHVPLALQRAATLRAASLECMRFKDIQ